MNVAGTLTAQVANAFRKANQGRTWGKKDPILNVQALSLFIQNTYRMQTCRTAHKERSECEAFLQYDSKLADAITFHHCHPQVVAEKCFLQGKNASYTNTICLTGISHLWLIDSPGTPALCPFHSDLRRNVL